MNTGATSFKSLTLIVTGCWIAARAPYQQTEAFRFGNAIVDLNVTHQKLYSLTQAATAKTAKPLAAKCRPGDITL